MDTSTATITGLSVTVDAYTFKDAVNRVKPAIAKKGCALPALSSPRWWCTG